MSQDDTSRREQRDADGSLTGGIRALVEDAQVLAEAELGFRKAQAAYAWQRGKGVALLLVLALFFLFFALMALVVGLLLALAPLLTAWGAMAAVTLGIGAIAAACFFIAVARFRRARTRLLGKDGGEA